MSPDTAAPSLGDNQASESKLSVVCTAQPREHRCRADLCPRNHMFFIYPFSFPYPEIFCTEESDCMENSFQRGLRPVTFIPGWGYSNLHIPSKDLNGKMPQ